MAACGVYMQELYRASSLAITRERNRFATFRSQNSVAKNAKSAKSFHPFLHKSKQPFPVGMASL